MNLQGNQTAQPRKVRETLPQLQLHHWEERAASARTMDKNLDKML